MTADYLHRAQANDRALKERARKFTTELPAWADTYNDEEK